MTSQRSISPHSQPTRPRRPKPRPPSPGLAEAIQANAAPKPVIVRGTWQQKLQRRIGYDPLVRTPGDDADLRHTVLEALAPVGAPGTRYHVTAWPADDPPPEPPEAHTWLRLDWCTWRLHANPPAGQTWAHLANSTGAYRRRWLDPELTAAQVEVLAAIPGNLENIGHADEPALRYLRSPHATNSIEFPIGLPSWHTGTEWDYDWTLPSGQINRKLPSEQIRSQYRLPDGTTDWLRWVRDQFEAEMGYPQIQAWWQYMDLRARSKAPHVSEAALESGIPKLRPTNVPKYIAAVSLALQAKRISQEEANAMLYAAQLLIGALKVIGPQQPAKPRGKQVAAARRAAELPILVAEVVP